MEIYEIDLGEEVYIGLDTPEYSGEINTILLEANLYGKMKFLKKEYFQKFLINGPIDITREEITKILYEHKDT